MEARGVWNTNFFGSKISGQGENQPDNWLDEKHTYWEDLQSKNKNKLDNLKKNISSGNNRLTQLDNYQVKKGESLSKILKNNLGLKGRKLLLALVHLKTSGVNIDRLNIGEKITIFSKDNGNMTLSILDRSGKQRIDATNKSLFPDTSFSPTEPDPEKHVVVPDTSAVEKVEKEMPEPIIKNSDSSSGEEDVFSTDAQAEIKNHKKSGAVQNSSETKGIASIGDLKNDVQEENTATPIVTNLEKSVSSQPLESTSNTNDDVAYFTTLEYNALKKLMKLPLDEKYLDNRIFRLRIKRIIFDINFFIYTMNTEVLEGKGSKNATFSNTEKSFISHFKNWNKCSPGQKAIVKDIYEEWKKFIENNDLTSGIVLSEKGFQKISQ